MRSKWRSLREIPLGTRDDDGEKPMGRLTTQGRQLSCLDHFGQGKRKSDRRPDDSAAPYDDCSPLPAVLDGEKRVKEAVEELERQNKYLRALVVSLSETIVRQVAAKKRN
jgi:hypothetical protein